MTDDTLSIGTRRTGEAVLEPLAERLRLARSRKGLSQAALAAALGVTQPTVANWEHDKGQPKGVKLRRLAQALDVRDAWLLSGAEPMEREDAPRTPAARYHDVPIRHVPIVAWPRAPERFDPAIAPARGRFAASTAAAIPFALEIDDPDMSDEFPKGTLLTFDGGERALFDGALHLVVHEGKALLRRWRTEPMRLEASNGGVDAIFVDAPPQSLGRLLVSFRIHHTIATAL